MFSIVEDPGAFITFCWRKLFLTVDVFQPALRFAYVSADIPSAEESSLIYEYFAIRGKVILVWEIFYVDFIVVSVILKNVKVPYKLSLSRDFQTVELVPVL